MLVSQDFHRFFRHFPSLCPVSLGRDAHGAYLSKVTLILVRGIRWLRLFEYVSNVVLNVYGIYVTHQEGRGDAGLKYGTGLAPATPANLEFKRVSVGLAFSPFVDVSNYFDHCRAARQKISGQMVGSCLVSIP